MQPYLENLSLWPRKIFNGWSCLNYREEYPVLIFPNYFCRILNPGCQNNCFTNYHLKSKHIFYMEFDCQQKIQVGLCTHRRLRSANTVWSVFDGHSLGSQGSNDFFRRECSGRVLDSRPKGRGFEPHCVVSLSKTHLSLLSTGSTQEDPSRHNWKIVDWDVKNQIKQNKLSSDRKLRLIRLSGCTDTDLNPCWMHMPTCALC